MSRLRYIPLAAATLVYSFPGQAAPVIRAAAPTFTFAAPPSIRIAGLAANLEVTVRFTAQTGPVPVSSEIHVTSDKLGAIDLPNAKVEETLWQVAPGEGADQHAMESYDEGQWSERKRVWRVSVLRADKELAATELVQRLLPNDATVTPVREQGMVGVLFTPAHPRNAGCLMVIGGSDGGLGWQGTMARALANRGYCAFALAYFGEAGLPDSLSRIPLEYFSGALGWLASRPGIDRRHLGLVGYSKGTEATLLLASTDRRVRVAAALLPSAYVFQAIGTGEPKSSWTSGGVDVPFVPYDQTSNWRRDRKPMAIFYSDSLRTNAGAIASATIPVEQIRGSTLLLAGGSDWSWPSAQMSGAMDERLAGKTRGRAHKRIAYANAGHSLAYPDYWVPISVMPQGTAETLPGTAAARRGSWNELVRFIEANL